ncbi:MAG TPA: carboxypeptidase regulatory-like domain-containing protein [Silvibacterium sp.]|nr:carboxypeptidase regulatory-like domain-containing protein [Silvibacterium sp.]
MRKTKIWLGFLFAALLLSGSACLQAQDTAKVHGHVQDPVGVPVPNATVQLSTDGTNAKYTFTTDASGDYKGEGIAPGTYILTLFNDQHKTIDQFRDVRLTSGNDTLQDFDMTRAEYIAKLSPEVKKQLEEVKAKNAAAVKENSQIKNLNADLLKARADNKDKNYAEAEELMSRDSQAKPDAAVLWVELGIAEKGLKKNDDAVTSLKKAVELDAASKKPNPDLQSAADDALGEVYATEGKVPEAQAAYDAAVQADPKGAAMHYRNEAIMMDRAGQGDATVAAADKAIAADPNSAIPYYLKGKALINKATVDPKTQKIVAPPGTEEAYQKYLELDPTGPFAADAKAILTEMGTTVKTTYKAGKK